MSDPITTGSNLDPGSSSEEFDPLDHVSDEPGQEAAEPAPDAPLQDAGPTLTLPSDLVEAMRRERLPSIPGEAPEAAYIRLSTHLQAKNRKLYTDLKEGERQSRQQQAELRQMLEPMLRDYYQRQRNAQLEEQAAQIPPKDSPEYQVWLLEETLRRDDERRQQEAQSALTWQQQQEFAREQEHLAQIDASGLSKVHEGLGLIQGTEPDPEFLHSYDLFSDAALVASRDLFPGADEDKILEFVANTQKLDIRRAEESGLDYRDVLKRRMNTQIDKLVALGLVQRVQGGGTGNGQPQQVLVQQSQAPGPPQRTVSQQVQANAQAAARRAPSAVPSSSRPTQLPGQMPDPSKFDSDEDFVEAVLSGILGNEEQRTSMHRKQRQ